MKKKFKVVLEELKKVLNEQRKIVVRYEQDDNVDQDHCFEIEHLIDNFNESLEEKISSY